ncbi:hypothetical protein COV20_04500 [Candidatus Woesearchaeota archaeon CG10_big_fil_rev_8_21_14_0_10_45_16]|nr:MAG: hypothetical protein COV20_04500 [Candidatus Woesearchaeota archaeon CG10_big_fil_rev_8_21_14_0_10_45_16]
MTLLLLTACGQGDSNTPVQGAFLGGTQGVVTVFEPFGVEENGLQTIFDTEAFPIEVTLQNKGEYQVQPGEVKVQLLGPAPEEFEGIPSRELMNAGVLDEISELVPEGGEETISFTSDAKFVEEVANFLDRDWFANIEYTYKTFVVVPEVCLKEDLTDTRVCDVREPKQFFVSGAPITVTAVEEDTAGRGIMALKLTLRNAGTGKVTMPGLEFDDTRERLAFSIDDPAWECKSAGKVNEARLFNGEAEIVCKLKETLPQDTLSTKQVKLTLDYKYRELIQEKLRVKQSN